MKIFMRMGKKRRLEQGKKCLLFIELPLTQYAREKSPGHECATEKPAYPRSALAQGELAQAPTQPDRASERLNLSRRPNRPRANKEWPRLRSVEPHRRAQL